MFNKTFENTRQAVEDFARKEQHEYITVEHLLLGLISDPEAREILTACGVDLDFLANELKRYLQVYIPRITGAHATPMMTKAYQRVLQRAIWHVQTSGQGRAVSGIDVLVAIFKERDSQAVALLKSQGISGLSVMRYLSHGMNEPNDEQGESEEDDSPKAQKSAPKKDPLKEFAQNLNERAKQGLTDPLIGRMAEIERTAQILCVAVKIIPYWWATLGWARPPLPKGWHGSSPVAKPPKP